MTALYPLAAHTHAEWAKLAAFEAAEEPEEIRVERVARALARHTQMHGLADTAFCSCGWQGDRFLHHLAAAAIAALDPS